MSGRGTLIAGSVILVCYGLMLLVGTVSRNADPMPADLLAFVAAARLAVAGRAAAAYDWDALAQAQAAVLGMEPGAIGGAFGWLNPPHFLFAVLPLAPFGYGWAWFLWALATALLLAMATWSIVPRGAAVVAVLAVPSTLLTISVGQNGLLIAALFAWTFALLDRRPVLAGLALGLLTIKPQFGLLLPLLLALTGRWRVFGAAAGAALAAMGLSWAAFGTEAWLAFLPSIGGNADRMLGGEVSPRIQSVYALVARLAAPGAPAVAGHAVATGIVIAVVLRLWLRRPEGPAEARAAAAIAASFLLTPYVWGYDTPVTAIAALFLARAALREGWLPGEKACLIVVCLLPAALIFVQHPIVMPLAWALLLWLAWRRDVAWRRGPAACYRSPSNGTAPQSDLTQ